MSRIGTRRVRSGGSLGQFAYRYQQRRARWYLTGIPTLRELLSLLRTVRRK